MIYHREAHRWEGIREGIWPDIVRQLPPRFGSAKTARRRLALWLRRDCLERAWRMYLLQLNRFELDEWKEALDARAVSGRAYWRFGLEQVWRMEVAPYLESGRGGMA